MRPNGVRPAILILPNAINFIFVGNIIRNNAIIKNDTSRLIPCPYNDTSIPIVKGKIVGYDDGCARMLTVNAVAGDSIYNVVGNSRSLVRNINAVNLITTRAWSNVIYKVI